MPEVSALTLASWGDRPRASSPAERRESSMCLPSTLAGRLQPALRTSLAAPGALWKQEKQRLVPEPGVGCWQHSEVGVLGPSFLLTGRPPHVWSSFRKP